MRITIPLLVIYCCLLGAGCAFHNDVSRLKPFSDYTGREVTLVVPACLVEEWVEPNGEALVFNLNPDKSYSGYFMSRSKRTPADTRMKHNDYGNGHVFLTPLEAMTNYEKRYTLWDEGENGCGLGFLEYWGVEAFGTQTAKFWTIPAGSKLFIERVDVNGNPFAGPYRAVTGRLHLDDLQKDIEFSYNWAAGFNLHRAPWEEESVPDRRYIGYKGNEYKE